MARPLLTLAALLLAITLFQLATGGTAGPGSPRPSVAAAAVAATATPTATASPFPTPTPTVTITPTPTSVPFFDYTATPTPTPVRPFPFTPQPSAPARDATLPSVGPLGLRWNLPPGSQQYQLQVLPGNGDGPGINLIRSAENSYTIAAPVLGQGPYILLPGMRYLWRLRATDKTTFAPEDDRAWGPWSDFWAFRTPRPAITGLAAVSPPDRSTLGSGATQLVWRNSAPDIFYYELQVSGDTRFDPNPGSATSFVWWNLVHSGVTDPPNSWRTPPLQPSTVYHWRVRPRVQGDGTPSEWGPVWSFTTAARLAIATPTPAATATPAPSPLLAFVSNRDHNSEIYTVRADDSAVTRLTTDDKHDDAPVWSPDGTKIAWVSDGRQWVMAATGSDRTQLATDVVGRASWATDNRRLTFVASGNLYVATANGSDLIRMTNTFPGEDHGTVVEAAWSPDGNRIAFVALKGEERNLYLINPDRTGLTLLTSGVEGQLAWSPDSARIAYVTLEARQDIAVLTVQTRQIRRLTSNEHDDFGPAWSPDGMKIAFVSTRDFNAEVYVMAADGSGAVRLTNASQPDEQPAWSRDGRQIAFVSGRDGNAEVYIMQADGSNLRNITRSPAADARPAWAPR